VGYFAFCTTSGFYDHFHLKYFIRREEYRNMLQVRTVEDRRAQRQFIRLPWSVYADDPSWIPPLMLERREHLSPRNPYFEHAQFQSWLAYRDGNAVGRISAQIDQLHLDHHQKVEGFFGMIEAEDNAETFNALLNAAEAWLRDHGMRRILGPYNLSVNQESGLLVDGFDTPPYMMMGHARPYYRSRIEENGYQKAKDLLAYIIDANFDQPAAVQAIVKRAKKRVTVRSLRKSNYYEDMKIIEDIFNDAWSENWGFIPYTEAEFKQLAKDFKLILDFNLFKIAEVDGAPAAFMVTVPNLNEAIRDLNGRLLPFGWLKLLWRLKVRYPRTARIPFMGVRKQYHGSLLGAALAFMVIIDGQPYALSRGIKKVELSWILEDNKGTRDIIESLGAVVYKRYRIYSKDLV
jgi:GNAT superfamily N-acetyltransferase